MQFSPSLWWCKLLLEGEYPTRLMHTNVCDLKLVYWNEECANKISTKEV
jgi:hypothetical protein